MLAVIKSHIWILSKINSKNSEKIVQICTLPYISFVRNNSMCKLLCFAMTFFLHNMDKLNCYNGSLKLPTAILFYTELVTCRENITEGMKRRFSDGKKFMKRKAAQAHEAIRTLGCMNISCVELSFNYFVCRCCC